MQRTTRSRTTDQATEAHVTSVLDSLRRTVRALRAAATTAETRLGISGAQLFALQKLADAPAPSLNALAARTLTQKSSISVVVSRLVARRLVRREPSAVDGRGIVLALTPAGRRALARAPESAQQRFILALHHLPPDDLEAFARIFARFTEALGLATTAPVMLLEDHPATHGPAQRPPRRAPALPPTPEDLT